MTYVLGVRIRLLAGFIFYRGWRLGRDASRSSIIEIADTAKRPSSTSPARQRVVFECKTERFQSWNTNPQRVILPLNTIHVLIARGEFSFCFLS